MTDSSKIGSGRCHGPGCTQTAKVEFWCSEACQARWDRQLAAADPPRPLGQLRLHQVTLVDQPLVSEWGVFEAFDGDGPDFEALPPALDGDSEERTCHPLTAPVATIDTVRQDEDGLHVTGRWLPVGSGAAYPQVASSPGWLKRAFRWAFGRTT